MTQEPATAHMGFTQMATHNCSYTRVGLPCGGADLGPAKDGAVHP